MSNLPPIVGNLHSIQNANSVLPARPPHTYIGMAQALLNGIAPLAIATPKSSIALAFVAAQVSECALKAYLSRDGDYKRLKAPTLGHNLQALWDLAQTEGLPLQAQPYAWFVTLSELQKLPYFIRYSTGVHGLVTPSAEPMATELAALVELVAQHL